MEIKIKSIKSNLFYQYTVQPFITVWSKKQTSNLKPMQHLTVLGVNHLQWERPETWQQEGKGYLWGTDRCSPTSEKDEQTNRSTNQRDEVKREAPRDQQSHHLHKRRVIYKNEHQSLSCVGKPGCIVMSEWCLTSAGKPHWQWQSSHWNWQCELVHQNTWGCRADSRGVSAVSPAIA